MNVHEIMDILGIIEEGYKNLYEELKEFPDIEYTEKDFIEKSKFMLLEIFGKFIKI